MGEGIERARDLDPEAARLIENLRDQLLIAFLMRLGGHVAMPTSEVDATGKWNFAFRIDGNMFHFELVANPVDQTASPPPADRTQCELTRPVQDGDYREINPSTGQQKAYVVLTAEERRKGFVRPLRRSYLHKVCGAVTTMAPELAETYARDPGFYSGTFCCHCRKHLPLAEFVWDGTDEQVGS